MSVLLAQLLRIAANCPGVRQAGPLMEKAADRIEKYRRELNTRTFLMGEDGRMMASLLERKQELETERDALRAELAAVKGQEAVGEVQLRTGGGISLLHVDLTQPLPPGTKLYASQPAATSEAQGHTSEAAPGVVGLVKALEHARLFIRNGIELGYISMPETDTPDPAHDTLPMIDTALSTWRQAQEGKP